MQNEFDHLPKWAYWMLSVLVHPSFREEIEGDLCELHASNIKKYGKQKSGMLLFYHLISLLKLTRVSNINCFNMSTPTWIFLALLSLMLILFGLSPFITGPQNTITHGLSRFTQMLGYLGLGFLPFGITWLITELRNKKEEKLNQWTNGYYPALLMLTPIVVFVPLQVVRSYMVSGYIDIKPLAFIVILIAIIYFFIHRLKSKTVYRFNTIPVFFVLLPLVALLTSTLGIENAAKASRERIIELSGPIIHAIEQYKDKQGYYPENLQRLEGSYISQLPRPGIMGFGAYHYERQQNGFQLSYEQLYHWSATEVVFYNSQGYEQKKYGYEEHATSFPKWKYHMAD